MCRDRQDAGSHGALRPGDECVRCVCVCCVCVVFRWTVVLHRKGGAVVHRCASRRRGVACSVVVGGVSLECSSSIYGRTLVSGSELCVAGTLESACKSFWQGVCSRKPWLSAWAGWSFGQKAFVGSVSQSSAHVANAELMFPLPRAPSGGQSTCMPRPS